MCRVVNIARLSDEMCIELARQAESYVIQRVRTAFPGASEAIRKLHTQGYTLHTASGESSLHLQGYLSGMGVRDCFDKPYGADLLSTLKETPEYYERLFADAHLSPADVLIVDDSPRLGQRPGRANCTGQRQASNNGWSTLYWQPGRATRSARAYWIKLSSAHNRYQYICFNLAGRSKTIAQTRGLPDPKRRQARIGNRRTNSTWL